MHASIHLRNTSSSCLQGKYTRGKKAGAIRPAWPPLHSRASKWGEGRSEVRQIWVQIPTFSLISLVTFSGSLHFPGPWLPNPQNRQHSILSPRGLFWELEILHVQCQVPHATGQLQIRDYPFGSSWVKQWILGDFSRSELGLPQLPNLLRGPCRK